MYKINIFFLIMLSILLVISCGETADKTDKCTDINCSQHGVCVIELGDPICRCDSGYKSEGISCIPVCQGVTCSNHGECIDQNGVATCECEDGYISEGTNCILLKTLDIHFKKPSNWNTPIYLYYWDTTPEIETTEWPGVEMDVESDNWYHYTIIGIDSANIIFNDGENQTEDLFRDSDGYYKGTIWYSTKPEDDPCEDINCDPWESCNEGICTPLDGRCNMNGDCEDGKECTRDHFCIEP